MNINAMLIELPQRELFSVRSVYLIRAQHDIASTAQRSKRPTSQTSNLPMPQSREQHCDPEVAESFQRAVTVPAERNIDVIAKPN